jgi:hypothetical protein
MLALAVARTTSMLDELLESESEEVWLVLITVLTAASAASTLDDEVDTELELALMAARAASTLVEEVTRLRLEV